MEFSKQEVVEALQADIRWLEANELNSQLANKLSEIAHALNNGTAISKRQRSVLEKQSSDYREIAWEHFCKYDARKFHKKADKYEAAMVLLEVTQ
jgi:hypothetical protein